MKGNVSTWSVLARLGGNGVSHEGRGREEGGHSDGHGEVNVGKN
jgi:hypothetical protein